MLSIIGTVGLLGMIVFASSKDDIVYPVVELGGCKNEKECRAYCSDYHRANACLGFAEKHNLMSVGEIKIARAMSNTIGPGGCRGEACRDYCEGGDENRMIQCMEFALNNPEIRDSLPEEDIEEMPQVLKALKAGVKMPGGCQNKEQCEKLCKNPSSRDVALQCFNFAKTAGFIPDNVPEEMVLKMMLEGGPDGCRGEDCEEVCEEEPQICITWMEKNGIDPMTVIPPEAKAQMQQGMQMMKQMLTMAPQSVKQCINDKLAPYGGLAPIEAGDMKVMMRVGEDMRDMVEDCFSSSFGGMMGGGGFGGGFRGMPSSQMMGIDEDDFEEGEEDYDSDNNDYDNDDYDAEEGVRGSGFKIPGGCADMQCAIQYCTKNFQDPDCQQAMQMMGVSYYPARKLYSRSMPYHNTRPYQLYLAQLSRGKSNSWRQKQLNHIKKRRYPYSY